MKIRGLFKNPFLYIFIKNLIFLTIGFLFMILLMYFVSAEGIGYEFIDSNTLHIYNNGSPSDWYYFGSCGNNLINNLNTPWENITFLVAYGNDLEQAFNSKVEIPVNSCDMIIKSDNSTFVNVTFSKIITFQGRNIRYRKEGYITLNDNYMREKFSGKNLGPPPINFPTWFFIKRNNISIGGSPEYDILQVTFLNGSNQYFLTNFSGFNKTFAYFDYRTNFILSDFITNENINFATDTENEYYTILDNKVVYSAFKLADSLVSSESVIINTWFQDAGSCACSFGAVTDSSINCHDGCNATVGNSFLMSCYTRVLLGSCTNCYTYFRYYTGVSYVVIPTNPTTAPLDCNGAQCGFKDNYGVWVDRTINCNLVWNKSVDCKSQHDTASYYSWCSAAPAPPVVNETGFKDAFPPAFQFGNFIYKPESNIILGIIILFVGILFILFDNKRVKDGK